MLRDIGVRIAQMADPTGHGGQLMNSLNITGDEVDLEDTLTRPDHRDEYERELAVMADVRAYFEIAYKVRSSICKIALSSTLMLMYRMQRVIDYIPLKIEQALNKHVAESMFSDLMQELGFNDGSAMDSLQELLAEDPKISQLREELKTNIERYDSYLRELRFFQHERRS